MKKLYLSLMLFVLGSSAAFSVPLTFAFSDLAADGSTAGDVLGVQVNFESATGAYLVIWTATAASPFHGNLNFNLNLGNERLSSLTTISGNGSALAPTTSISFSGTSFGLTSFLLGDSIVSFGGTPKYSTAFNSGIVDLDNVSSRDNVLAAANVVSAAAGVPDSGSSCLLFSLGLAGLAMKRRLLVRERC